MQNVYKGLCVEYEIQYQLGETDQWIFLLYWK